MCRKPAYGIHHISKVNFVCSNVEDEYSDSELIGNLALVADYV